MSQSDTIVAIATPTGIGGVGVVRVSGKAARSLAISLTGIHPKPRYAHYATATDHNKETIDKGLLLYFQGPNSYTGEDVIEFQGHGSPIVLDRIMRAIISSQTDDKVRQAEPGEFTQRAFLNDKLDLTQAEAVADLIEARTEKAANAAIQSLEGAFSDQVHALRKTITELRVYVESALDFSDEDIDFMSEGNIAEKISQVISQLEALLDKAKMGKLLRSGMDLAIVGAPNAGKSSLLNRLAGTERAIVTDIAGTTRDTIHEVIQLDGFPVNIIDTAGLRDTNDEVERLGIEKTIEAIERADVVVWLRDATMLDDKLPSSPNSEKVIEVHNKTDLVLDTSAFDTILKISALTGRGIEELKSALKAKLIGFSEGENPFSARTRHLRALEQVHNYLTQAYMFACRQEMPELVAEELRYAQETLGEITGEFTQDDLLGQIFSDFCIGK